MQRGHQHPCLEQEDAGLVGALRVHAHGYDPPDPFFIFVLFAFPRGGGWALLIAGAGAESDTLLDIFVRFGYALHGQALLYISMSVFWGIVFVFTSELHGKHAACEFVVAAMFALATGCFEV